MPPGDTMFFVDTASNGAIDTVLVTRLNDLTYWVVSEGRAGTGVQLGSRRRTGMVITLGVPNMRIPGTVVSRGSDSVGGSSSTSGNDVQPSGWDCPPAGPPASVLVGPDTTVKYLGKSYTMTGSTPLVREDPLASDTNSYFNLEGDGWTGMTSKATIVINNPGSLTISDIYPRTLSGSCVPGPSNWGDWQRNALLPGPCETYFPTVYIRGSGTTLLNGGGPPYRGGQGILLVDGNLEIAGNFTYKGLIIVRGRIKTTGTGVKVQGGVMTANLNGMWNDIRGDASIQYSRCAIMTVLQQKAWPKPAKERAWADMF
jgi:hypothetical protein